MNGEYNKKHGITPKGITKDIDKGMRADLPDSEKASLDLNKVPKEDYKRLLSDLTQQMDFAAKNLQFEQAAELRDTIEEVRALL